MSESEPKIRQRWVSLGEIIALAALIISGLGLWLTWKNSSEDWPTRVVEQRQSIPLTLRGKVGRDGRKMEIAPVEPSHALQSLTVAIPGAYPIELGSDGMLDADTVAAKIKSKDKGPHSVRVRIDARYVEMGKDRRGGGNYVLRYKWEGGGLFAGRSLRLIGLSR